MPSSWMPEHSLLHLFIVFSSIPTKDKDLLGKKKTQNNECLPLHAIERWFSFAKRFNGTTHENILISFIDIHYLCAIYLLSDSSANLVAIISASWAFISINRLSSSVYRGQQTDITVKTSWTSWDNIFLTLSTNLICTSTTALNNDS